MFATLTEYALARRWFVLVLALALAALGARAFQQIPIDAFPDVSTTQVKLILKAPGMTPEEIEARITQPVETELLGIPRQTILRSLSKNALVDITVDFEEGTDIYWARQQVAERFANVKGELPDNVSGGLAPISTPLSELFMFTIEGPLSLAEKRSLLDWTIRPQLRALPGVADVNSLGGRVATFSVSPDPAALAARWKATPATTAPAASTKARKPGSCASVVAWLPSRSCAVSASSRSTASSSPSATSRRSNGAR